MATTASDTYPSPESATEALKRRKKQARREAKLMLELNVLLHQRVQGRQAHQRRRRREHRLRPNNRQIVANVPGSHPQMLGLKSSVQANRAQHCFHGMWKELYGNCRTRNPYVGRG